MLIKYFDYLDIMKFLSLFIDSLINDGAWAHSAAHTTCTTQAHPRSLCSAGYTPGDDLLQTMSRPALPTAYHASNHSVVALNNWYFANQIFSITKMRLSWFLC